jgi:signal peptidase II
MTIAAMVVLLFDLWTKSWAQTHWATTPLSLTSWFEFTYSENPWIALGIPFGGPLVLLLSGLLIVGFIAYALLALDLNRLSVKIAVSLILGGAVGNFYDRLTYGIVRDFIHIGDWHIFNLADAAISIGVALLLIHIYRPSHEPSSRNAQ